MNLPVFWLFIPFISAFIGWFTNFITIKLLFRPYQEKRILFLRIQGIFPKRREVFTEKLSIIVAEQILSADSLIEKINQNQNLDGIIVEHVRGAVRNLIDKKIKDIPLLSSFISGNTLQNLEEMFLKDLHNDLKPVKERLFQQVIMSLKLKEAVREYLSTLSMKELEQLIHSVLKKEFKFIELSGAVLGFLIGIIQLAIVLW